MVMKFKSEILDAIRKAIDEMGSQAEFSKKTGVNHKTVWTYAANKVKNIDLENWQRLYPYIKKFLPQGFNTHVAPQNTSWPPAATDFPPGSELSPVAPGTLKPVPVLSFAQAAGFEPALEPICDFLGNFSDITETFVNVKPGYFALTVEGNSMSPMIPPDSIVLIGGGVFPERGDIVAAKLSTGQVVIKKYFRKDNVITLESVSSSGQNFSWHCKDQPGFAVWIYPVIEAKVNLRRQRWEKTISGQSPDSPDSTSAGPG
jgi:SOS-response transcriptional repressor LexA